MPAFLIPAIMAGTSLLSGYLANRKRKQEQEQQSTQNIDRTTSTNMLDMPEFTAEGQSLLGSLTSQYLNRMRESPQELTDSLTTNALQSINRGSTAQRKSLESILAARGLSGSAIGGNAIAGLESGRIGQQVGALNTVPQLVEQFLQQRLQGATDFFSRIPTGTRRTGEVRETGTVNTTGKQTTTDPGNPLGGAFSSLATTLAGLYGGGAFNKQNDNWLNTGADPHSVGSPWLRR